MSAISSALRQAFMPKHEYETLREEDRIFVRVQRPVIVSILAIICISIIASVYVSMNIVFASDPLKRPYCDMKMEGLDTKSVSNNGDEENSDVFPGAFYLTNQQTVDYYWMVVFVPSSLLFSLSFLYLLSGITVAYTAPARHWSLKVVENNYCASKRGGVRCLAILNLVFAIIFGLLALFLGSTLLTLGSSCSSPLFWCYEITSWGLVILYAATAFFLRRKAAVILDESDSGGRNFGLEMLEANPVQVTPDMEKRVNEGFKSWMGSSYLSSDEEEDPDDYLEVPHVTRTNSNRQRV